MFTKNKKKSRKKSLKGERGSLLNSIYNQVESAALSKDEKAIAIIKKAFVRSFYNYDPAYLCELLEKAIEGNYSYIRIDVKCLSYFEYGTKTESEYREIVRDSVFPDLRKAFYGLDSSIRVEPYGPTFILVHWPDSEGYYKDIKSWDEYARKSE